ncbi:hypothetical protein HSX37_08475|uniref:Uncharacterized protein n=1 Tax=Dendrosporobacter quercicolus TaxID=146817 RepID=A0A1G9UNM8_9FIRM|nr:hypothetical protein [Dendrosporobacter quercicolus]NSL48076.1 hypothetical protein [Dendrosporobacter quercicolus DSM 1736]SDM61538.1 hypothetical protein SAMN04488502_1069 [Dendrosporobacter quercicolus]
MVTSNSSPLELDEADLDMLVILAAILAIVLAKEKTSDEVNAIGNFFAMLGLALTVLGSAPIAAQRSRTQPPEFSALEDMQQQINQLKLQLELLHDKLSGKEK